MGNYPFKYFQDIEFDEDRAKYSEMELFGSK
jgi:hypothetical protein